MVAGRRILLAYLVYYAAIGAAFPYLPVFYRDIGMGLGEIGLLTAIQATIGLLLAPIWGGLGDRFPRSRLALPASVVVATVGATILLVARDVTTVFIGSTVLYAGLAGITPGLDTRTLETLGPERRGRFGEVRAFGSLAFVISTVAVGILLDAEGARALFWAYIPFLVATIVVTAAIPRRGTPSHSVDIRRGAGEFLRQHGILLFLVGFTVVWAALGAVTAFYSIQVVALGGTPGLVGLTWAFGAVIEVPYMFAFPRIAGRIGTEQLVVGGAVLFALRALLAALATDPLVLLLIEPLEGLGFASVYVGGVTVVASRAPAGLQGTAQGIFSACTGLAAILGAVMGGALAAAFGIPGLFLAMAAVGVVGAAIIGVALLRPGVARVPRPGRDGQPA
jgi:PPP family 3-phenylpropionic acid transporter